mgnify:CR=1 FL=1
MIFGIIFSFFQTMSHSTDIRQKMLDFVNKGGEIKEACNIFNVSRSSFQRWVIRLKKTGSLEEYIRKDKPYKIDNTELKKFIKNKPDAYLNEISSHFKVTLACISIALKRLKISRKKKVIFTLKEMKKKD